MELDDDVYFIHVIMLISNTISLSFNSFNFEENVSYIFLFFRNFEIRFLLFTLFCFREKNWEKTLQPAKKAVSNSPGLEDSILNLPDGQVKFFEEFKLQPILPIKMFLWASWNDFWASIC